MFSTRTDWDTGQSPLYSLLQKKRSAGEHVIDLAESNPTRCGLSPDPPPIDLEAIQRSAVYEPDPKGLLTARQAVAGWYTRQGIILSPDQIILTASSSEAYSFLLKLLCNPGECVAVPKPSYPLFDYLCQLNDVKVVHYRLVYDGEWHVDFQSLEEALSAGARGVILVHPNNPTGSYVKKDEHSKILQLAASHHAALIVDEVFYSFAFGADEPRGDSFASVNEVLAFTINGFSKLVALPQFKLAWCTVSGPSDLSYAALARLEVIADTYLSVGTLVQHSAASILARQPEFTGRVIERVRANYLALEQSAVDTPMTILRCEGGWNAMIRLPAILSDEAWAIELLERANILVHPGHLFECEINACLIVSLLPEPAAFLEGVRRLRSFVCSDRQRVPHG